MRINALILSALLLIFPIAFASCGEDNTVINEGWNSGSLSVVDEVLLDGTNNQSINIKASSKPSLSSDAAWLKVGEVKNISTGLYNVELKADANTSGETRIAKVTVTAGKETATVTVTQTSSDVIEIKSIDPKDNLNPDGGRITINYVATGTPATNLPEWMSVVSSRSLEEGTLTISYQPNNTGADRVGMIVLAVGKGAVATLQVTQPSR